MDDLNIGLVGAGNMAGALIRGLLASGVSAEKLVASDVRKSRLEELEREHKIRTTPSNAEVARHADVVVLSVKPQVLGTVLADVAGGLDASKLIVSIAAGVPIRRIEGALPQGTRVVRAMPNTPALVLEAATALARGSAATDSDLETAQSLFSAVGTTVVVDESALDAVTGLSGSGPAYVMLIVEALSDGGVKAGLPREVALKLAAQTVLGAAKLLVETGEHPARLKDMVTSPAGTTITGLSALEARGVRSALVEAVEQAARRAAELGRDA